MRPPRVSLMRDRWAAGALVLVLAAGLAACGGDTEPEEPEATAVVVLDEELSALATEFIDQLFAGDFEAAAASFDDTMADALPAADLAATWQQITDQVGAYQGEITRRQEVVDVYEAVIVTAQFEQTPLDIRIVFDTDRRIAGLFFQAASATGEPTAEAWAPPSYAGDVEDREVVVGEFDLPGTLTTPGGDGPWPAVVLVHGSGPNDRDETIGPNKPFRDLALGLAGEGIAVLTYDKRTLARPSDLPADLTVAEEVVDDAVAAVELLRTDRTVAIPDQVFLLGHSLGGMLAPRIAVESGGVAGLVLMAAPARPLEELILEQTRYLAERDGTVTTEEESALAEVAAQVEAVRDPTLGADTPPADLLGAPASYWLDLRDYRPTEMAAGLALDIPILVLQGERDYQVTMTDFALWQEALAEGEDVEFRSFPGLNHLMMPGEGEGLSVPEDYEVAGHVEPEVVDAIAAFIRGED